MNTLSGASTGQVCPLFDPRAVREDRRRFRRDPVPGLERANGIYVPSGRWHARGWVLVRRGDYDRLDRYNTSLQLEIGDSTGSDNVGVLGGLSIVQAQCVTRGVAADSDALYLVELTDVRGVLHNNWFQYPITTQYNIRSPAYPQTFHPASMDSGTTWTWSTMLEDMWDRMGTLLGAWPGLPLGGVPAGTPEGFWFTGVAGWPAMCDVLDHLGLTVACDLTSAAPYTIVRPGVADAAFTALRTRYGTAGSGSTGAKYLLEDDLEWIDVGAGRVPGTVVVFFKRRNAVYGTEETVTYRSDEMADQWDMDTIYSVSVAAPTIFWDAVGTHHIWSDFTIRYDDSGNPLDADIHAARLIARGCVSQYFDRIYGQTLGRLSQTYIGALPFATGSLCDGVAWTMDFSHQDRQGWRTKVVRGCVPPFPGVCE